MSNQLVGTVYSRIIQDVIEASQVDFEEGGVDQQTLEDLREVWQRKLSSLNVAAFPWDPAPVAPPLANTPTVPSNASRTPITQPGVVTPTQAPTTLPPSGAEPTIKTEPGLESGAPVLPQANGITAAGINAQAAQQRAATLMQQQFGDQASRQIGALQSGIALPGQQRSQGLQLPGQPMPTHVPQQYQTPQPQQPQQQQRNGLGGAQTDGADDAMEEWNAIVMRRNALGQHEQLGTVAIDRMIRRQIEDMGQRMEGGGLMLPLSERVSTISRRKRGTKKSATSRSRSGLRARSAQFQSSDPRELLPAVSELSIDANEPKIPQLDGGDDSDDGIKGEDFDEDAINSELDDSDDNIAEEDDEDESIGQIMLCTYDKVQRVKNKWKCTLKDGVLTTGNREYVFHKAQGEFEW